MMEKLGKLYEGKAKKLYATNDPDVLWVEYMNQATAGNGAKKAQIQGKGELNNRITTLIFWSMLSMKAASVGMTVLLIVGIPRPSTFCGQFGCAIGFLVMF